MNKMMMQGINVTLSVLYCYVSEAIAISIYGRYTACFMSRSLRPTLAES